MMKYIHFMFILFQANGMLLALSLNNDVANITIVNLTNEPFYTNELYFDTVRYGDTKLIYFFSSPIDQSDRDYYSDDKNKYDLRHEIQPHSTITLQIEMKFRTSKPVKQYTPEGEYIWEWIPNYYTTETIIFQFYFIRRPMAFDDYDEYNRTIKNEGYVAEGYLTNSGEILFVIR